MRIAICDDVALDSAVAKKHIIKFAYKNNYAFAIDIFNDGKKFLEMYSDILYPVVFLDIYMGDMTGIEVAAKMRQTHEDSKIVFMTTSTQHMLNGFELGATHYLVKPINYAQVEQALLRCRQCIEEDSKIIEVISEKIPTRIRIKNIVYIEVFKNASIIHTEKREIKTYIPLGELEELLGSQFLRTHRSYLVNMDYVSGVNTQNFLLCNGQCLPIRKNGAQNVREKYLEYRFKKLKE